MAWEEGFRGVFAAVKEQPEPRQASLARQKLIQGARTLSKGRNAYPRLVRLVGRQDKPDRRKSTVRRRDAGLSQGPEGSSRDFQVYRRRRKLIGRKTTLPEARQAYPPPDNVIAEQSSAVLKAFKAACRRASLNRRR
jgi:hypothetical protein